MIAFYETKYLYAINNSFLSSATQSCMLFTTVLCCWRRQSMWCDFVSWCCSSFNSIEVSAIVHTALFTGCSFSQKRKAAVNNPFVQSFPSLSLFRSSKHKVYKMCKVFPFPTKQFSCTIFFIKTSLVFYSFTQNIVSITNTLCLSSLMYCSNSPLFIKLKRLTQQTCQLVIIIPTICANETGFFSANYSGEWV